MRGFDECVEKNGKDDEYMIKEFVPVVAWGWIGIVAALFMLIFGFWGIIRAIAGNDNERTSLSPTDATILTIIFFFFANVFFIAALWEFGII